MIFSLLLATSVLSSGQAQQRTTPPAQTQQYPKKMEPEMTEIMDPEVKIIQPGAQPGDAPSDAIVLFDGNDVNKEWTDNKGNPTKWIVKDGDLDLCQRIRCYQDKTSFQRFPVAYRMENTF